MRMVAGTCALLALLPTSAASARLVYFHKAGTPVEAASADHGRCAELAAGVQAPRQQLYTPDAYSAAAAAFFSGLFGARDRRRLAENVMRTCMIDKGYRRIEAPREVERELKSLSRNARVQRMLLLSGAAKPQGKALNP